MQVINVASVPHRSPFRYPGGKTWLVPHVRRWLASLDYRPKEFCEPFAGGAIVGLSTVFDDLVDTTTLIEMDENVASVWRTILNGKGKALAERIVNFRVNYKNVRDVLDADHRLLFDRAFATIIRNRMQRGGILAPGASLMKDGENGRGLLSRWYPQTLERRILDIVAIKKRITFIQGDGIAYLRQHAKRRDMAFLIDPPYTVAGRRLYAHSEIDHDELFAVTAKLQSDFLMTYDNCEPVRKLARKHGFDTQTVAMKNT
ncbi:MAG: DNA adenine methylase, partial [Gammaproteobacteria bacterium]